MVKHSWIFILIILTACSVSDDSEYVKYDDLTIIPNPVEMSGGEGFFKIDEFVQISTTNAVELTNEASYLSGLICENSTFCPTVSGNEGCAINLGLNETYISVSPEKYTLSITENRIELYGATEAAVMRGIQTIRQLFLPAFYEGQKRDEWNLPCLEIIDYPEYEHRGMLLDVCRHFFDKEVIKDYIDLLAFYKMNTLHLHLTEDQGWRFESEKYPLLNTISSVRKEKDGSTYGGLLSKEDLKEIAEYAELRHINVIPEIEMPGHSQAALAAYPHLSCTGGPIEVANDWGVYKEIYCAGNDSVFTFLEDILLEVMEIFPSKYIHIGGDEAPKARWEQCPKCQKRMRDEGLENEYQLQSYFIQRIDSFLTAHDRILIGWDEILEGGLSENAVVQSWRGMDGGMEAAIESHEVIMSPTSHCYLDYSIENIDLEKIYTFDPLPPTLPELYQSYIIGGECNMWTEHVPDRETLDQKVLPRMIGFAEALWCEIENSDFKDFYERIQSHYPILTAMGFTYGQELIPVSIEETFMANSGSINLVNSSDEFSSKYRWFCEQCDTSWTLYGEELFEMIRIDKDAIFQVQPMKNGEPYGPLISQEYNYHKAMGAYVDYETDYHDAYTGGGKKGLVNGRIGTLDFRDGNWQGFWGSNMGVFIDMFDEQQINAVSMNFYQYANAWIMMPTELLIAGVDENNSIEWAYGIPIEAIPMDSEKHIVPFKYEFEDPKYAQRVQIVLRNFGAMPDNHEAAGEPSWIFVDEIVIE